MTAVLDDYLSKEQAAKELGRQPRTLDRWHVERRGPRRTKVGRSVYYKRSDLAEWLERCAEETAA